MPIGQFYEVDVDNSVPFRICGGLQDNGVWCVPSAVRNRNGIADRDAWNIGGGDGFHAHFDPTNNAMVLQSSQNGNAAWVNIETLERQGVRPGTAIVRQPVAVAVDAAPRRLAGRRRGGGGRAADIAGTGIRRSSSRITTPRPGSWARSSCSRAPIADRAGRRSAAISR